MLLLCGLVINLWLVHTWYGRSLGPLDLPVTLRQAFWGFTLMVIGVQTIYGSFFLSMLGMTKEDAEKPKPESRPKLPLTERVHRRFVFDRRVHVLADQLGPHVP